MTIKDTFLSPDYYPSFSCKGPDCRHTCCNGLTINMSQQEYFKLVGLSCSSELRQGLDLAIKPLSNPDPYKYAELCHDFFGNCRMLMDNGWCRLQYECGEDVMTYACRYFPRSPRLNISPRVSCSCGCEKTIEMLMDCDAGIRTTTGEYSFDLAGEEKKSEAVTKDILETIQNDLFDILQKEDTDIDTKISDIKAYLESKDSKEIIAPTNSLMDDSTRTSSSDIVITDNDSDAMSDNHTVRETVYLKKLINIAAFVKDQYYTMSDYCGAFLKVAESDNLPDALKAGADKLHTMFPDLDHWICRMFVNDIFYTQFPFNGEEMSMSQAGELLECEIRFLQILLYSNADNITNKDNLVDLCMYYFRMADFTPFSHNAIVLMNRDTSK